MKFNYSEYPTPEEKSIYRPSIPILFKHKENFIMVEAIVDSGADFIILPIEMASVLHLKLNPKEKTSFYGAGNNPFTVYPSPSPIELIVRQSGYRQKKWQSIVYFAESQPAILLGNRGFLDQFKITLDGKKKELLLI